MGYRVALYGHPQILSLDEAMLALNVARRSWAGLLTPLAFQQTAPVLYLWSTKLALLAGGVTEAALRAVPFIAGLALVPLVWLATRDLVSRPTAWVAAALAALFPLGVAYSTIAKPYTIDAAVTALLLVVAMSPAPRWWLVASIVTPFLSTPSVFVNASCLVARHRDVRAHPQIAIAWVAAVASNFLLFQRPSADAPYLQHFWAQSFPHLPLGATLQLVQLRAGFLMQDLFTGYSVAYPRAWHWVLLVVVLVGVTHIARRRGAWAAVMLAGPIVAVGLAAAVHLYPLADRTLLFTAPLVLIAMAGALDAVATVGGAPALALASILIVAPDVIDLVASGIPPSDARVRGGLAAVWRHAEAGEAVYVFSLDVPRWTFYTTDWSHPDTARLDRIMTLASTLGPNSGNAPPRGHTVAHEGHEFILHTPTHTELLGVPTGVEILSNGPTHRDPDPGWATNEASRVRQVAAPTAWLVFLHGRSLAPALADTLGQMTDSLVVANALIAYEYVQPAAGAVSTDGATDQTPATPAPDRGPIARATPPP